MATSTSPVSPVSAGSGPARLDQIERLAWRVSFSSRGLYLGLAALLAVVLVWAGVVAGVVLTNSRQSVAEAREQGVGVARAATEFRTELGVADAQAAASVLSGGLEEPTDRATYDNAVLQASNALTEAAGLTDSQTDVSRLADGLVQFNGSVETSRANSRQGYPVGAAYLRQARELARHDLVPRADALRRDGERTIARSANDVGGAGSAVAVGALTLALAVLLAAEVVIAGRSRRMIHPGLAIATVLLGVSLLALFSSVTSQSTELSGAATEELQDYLTANAASSALSTLRVTEIDAVVARGSGAPLYADALGQASNLEGALTDAEQYAAADAVRDYAAAVVAVREKDLGGDNQGAAGDTLSGASALSFATTRQYVDTLVQDSQDALTARIDTADDYGLSPSLPIGLGLVAAAFSTWGCLARARRYR